MSTVDYHTFRLNPVSSPMSIRNIKWDDEQHVLNRVVNKHYINISILSLPRVSIFGKRISESETYCSEKVLTLHFIFHDHHLHQNFFKFPVILGSYTLRYRQQRLETRYHDPLALMASDLIVKLVIAVNTRGHLGKSGSLNYVWVPCKVKCVRMNIM